MSTRLQCLLAMLGLSLIGFGPLSITCLIGLHAVLARPDWLLRTTRALYGRPTAATGLTEPAPNGWLRLKVVAALLALLLLDIAPVPVTGTIGLSVVLLRPPWFLELVEAIYAPPRP